MFVVPNKVAHVAVWGFLLAMGSVLMYAIDLGGSHADLTTGNVNVQNVAPIIESHDMNIGGPITDGTTVSPGQVATITGTIRDDNGDTPTVTMVTSLNSWGGNCLGYDLGQVCQDATCTVIPNADPIREDYSCTITIPPEATATTAGSGDPTDYWRWKVTANDGYTSVNEFSSIYEVDTLLSQTSFGSINLGSITVGGESSLGSYSMSNSGNVTIVDLLLSSSQANWTCPAGGTLPREHLRYGVAAQSYAAMTPMTGTPTAFGINLGPCGDLTCGDAEGLRFRLSTSNPIPGGVCTIPITFTATDS